MRVRKAWNLFSIRLFVRLAGDQRFFSRLSEPLNPSEAPRIEGGLATARAFLAACALVALYLGPVQAARDPILVHLLFLAYAAYSLGVVFWIRVRPESVTSIGIWVHGVDTAWPALMAFLTEGPHHSFLVFSVFAFIAAAYRWGLRETLLTAVAVVALLLLAPGEALIRAPYLLLLALLLGYLGQEQRRLRAEASEVVRILGKVQSADGLRATLKAVAQEMIRLFEARAALVVLRESKSGRTYLWEVRSEADASELQVYDSELKRSEYDVYFFPAPGHSWHTASGTRGSRPREVFQLFALDREGRRLKNTACAIPDAFLASHAFGSLMAVSVAWGSEWSGRLILIDPRVGGRPAAELRVLQNLVSQLAPTVYSAFLASRLRSQAGAMERARVARELHDGIIQSLIAVEMHIQVLRYEASQDSAALANELDRLQQILRDEVLNLRELTQRLKPVEVRPADLLDFLADSVERFQRETGIGARFLSEYEAVVLPPRICRELARIVQEALVNVRRHSGAHNVLVGFERDNGNWKLVIDDDGRGFPFSGRLSQDELDRARKGPVVIKERVRAMGGELTVESAPGRGTRLEITIPGTSHD